MKKNLLLCALVSLTFSLTATAQQITGSVSDDNGIPLPGASIVIANSSSVLVGIGNSTALVESRLEFHTFILLKLFV